MTREQKILKLKKHKAYSKFMKNVINTERVERNFDSDIDFNFFIGCCFDWKSSNEGLYYWHKISLL